MVLDQIFPKESIIVHLESTEKDELFSEMSVVSVEESETPATVVFSVDEIDFTGVEVLAVFSFSCCIRITDNNQTINKKPIIIKGLIFILSSITQIVLLGGSSYSTYDELTWGE